MEAIITLSDHQFTDLSACFMLAESLDGSTHEMSRLNGKILWFPELQRGCCFKKFTEEQFKFRFGKKFDALIRDTGLRQYECNMVFNGGSNYLALTTSHVTIIHTVKYDIDNVHVDIPLGGCWIPHRNRKSGWNTIDMSSITYINDPEGMVSDYWYAYVKV